MVLGGGQMKRNDLDVQSNLVTFVFNLEMYTQEFKRVHSQ